ncbi:MAG TPA: Uma2 family endonuclease [Oculatellaceae cyanobacterium]|jgi:Uma2 family endonuclease
MADVGENRGWRFAFDRGILEIRRPIAEYELFKGMLDSFIGAIADEIEIEVMSVGALTLEREDLSRAIEPDSCFYIQNEALVRGKSISLPQDPPPDLAIKSDYTNSSVKKFDIYAALGVPELWRYSEQTLQVYQLVEGKYQECDAPSEPLRDRSLAFPILALAEIPGLIEQSQTVGQRTAVRLLKQRIREILANSTAG